MSHYYASAAHEVMHIITDIKNIGIDQARSIYGIEFIEDDINGRVFDPTYNREFNTLGEWATFSVEQDFVSDHEPFHKHEDDYHQ